MADFKMSEAEIDQLIEEGLGESRDLLRVPITVRYVNTAPYFEAVDQGAKAVQGQLIVFEKRIPGDISEDFKRGKKHSGKYRPGSQASKFQDRHDPSGSGLVNPKLVFATRRVALRAQRIMERVEPEIENLLQTVEFKEASSLLQQVQALKPRILKILQDNTPFLPDPPSGPKPHMRFMWEVTIDFEDRL